MSNELDYLFLEELFIKRIQESVPGLADVKGIPELQALADQTPATPAAYVVYLGDGIIPDAPGQGGLKKIQLTKQYWAVVLGVQTADAEDSGGAARREAGPLLGKLLTELQGWEPAEDVDALARAPRQATTTYNNGIFYFPLVFYTSFVFPRVKEWQPPS